ncbi:hypothetical protein GGTG_14303 [Gaeumannomyces tritici R3-111a-1]|uniref:Antifungal protein n=1 Tax=Gaeumannomyces tritici (strain R3-111a-1) TaxID=644352 RepID=J3PL56_GAET3|nr:hypothetical protein GGTG_14303 [Gaeumannomyces tritici R3-111a-1]EJT68117.1 hypothetical protein GGTG_14303 [Gaeumannomyces tritici R3-111a-1]
MQFKTLFVVAFAGLVIAAPMPATLAERIKANERGTTQCSKQGNGALCQDFQGGICTIGPNGKGGTCLF